LLILREIGDKLNKNSVRYALDFICATIIIVIIMQAANLANETNNGLPMFSKIIITIMEGRLIIPFIFSLIVLVYKLSLVCIRFSNKLLSSYHPNRIPYKAKNQAPFILRNQSK
jgi:hypothetical protein